MARPAAPTAGSRIGRRQFLRGFGATGIGAVVLETLPKAAIAAPRTVAVWRLSTRGEPACNACKGTGANRYYRASKFANRDRAHRGCNCDILSQQIPRRAWNKMFVKPNHKLRNVFDVRWGK